MSQHKIKQAAKAKQEAKLDEALMESFPGSDPVSLSEPALPDPEPAAPVPSVRRKSDDKAKPHRKAGKQGC